MFLLPSILVPASFAARYDVELLVSAQVGTRIGRGVVARENTADAVGRSKNPSVTCDWRDDMLWVGYRRDGGVTEPPFDTTCRVGGDRITVRVRPMNPATDPTLQPRTLDGQTARFAVPDGMFVALAFPLPAGAWVGGDTPSTVNGVVCTVQTSAAPTVLVRVEAGGAPATGWCDLPRGDGSSFRVDLDITSGPKG